VRAPLLGRAPRHAVKGHVEEKAPECIAVLRCRRLNLLVVAGVLVDQLARRDWVAAAPGVAASFTQARERHGIVETGVFGADMKVSLINDGPVTFWLQVDPVAVRLRGAETPAADKGQ